MRVAFYAPLNPPDGPTPSGDRLIARMLMRALEQARHEVVVASRLRTFDGRGNSGRQEKMARIGGRLAPRLVGLLSTQPPDLWLTYHLYHKAPDHFGPVVARALGIPYAVVEASVSPAASSGPWASGHHAVIAALGEADLVIGINPKDRDGVQPALKPGARYAGMPVFTDGADFRAAAQDRALHRRSLLAATGACAQPPLLLAVGMMRSEDKLNSYRLLADALVKLSDRDWHLVVVGDGVLMTEARALFARLPGRVTFAGRVAYDRLPAYYAGADLLVWPAIREALGMCFLEAQAAGTPVVGSNRPGVTSLIRDGATGLTPAYGDADAFASAVARLIDDRPRLLAMRDAAASYALATHDLTTAGPRFAALVQSAVSAR